MALAPTLSGVLEAPAHSRAFRARRFLNWFPMGLAYAFLYMGRYNLNVAKNALGDLMTKEDFSVIFGVGTVTYGVAFLLVGPITDAIGGRRSLLVAAFGAALANAAMGFYLQHALGAGEGARAIRYAFTGLYAVNMFFQSFGAVSIVKVNAPWFHVRERGGFSGIFGVMISSGLFFAYTVNAWLLDWVAGGTGGAGRALATRWVFFAPAALLAVMGAIEAVVLRDKPSDAGLADFDTGDAPDVEAATSFFGVVGRVLTHPVLLMIAFIEFCTGVLRNGVMAWYPIYVNEIAALPRSHYLNTGDWGSWYTIWPFFGVAALLFVLAARASGRRRNVFRIAGGVLFLAPFLQGGWGGLQMVAGVVGGTVAGYVSDLFFQSRRAPAAAGLYALMIACTLAMASTLGQATPVVRESHVAGLEPGDRITAIAGHHELHDWAEVKRAFACIPAPCAGGASFDASTCTCATKPAHEALDGLTTGTIDVVVERPGLTSPLTLRLADPAVTTSPDGVVRAKLRAGDARTFNASPVLTLSPYWLGVIVFLISLSVIGTHGLLSGTATMDFGGRKGTATAVGMIDGFVYLGVAVQSFGLGYLTSKSWGYWPWFLVPFAVVGFALCLRIWNARPAPRKANVV